MSLLLVGVASGVVVIQVVVTGANSGVAISKESRYCWGRVVCNCDDLVHQGWVKCSTCAGSFRGVCIEDTAV